MKNHRQHRIPELQETTKIRPARAMAIRLHMRWEGRRQKLEKRMCRKFWWENMNMYRMGESEGW